MLLALGVLAAADALGAHVLGSAYVALALGIVGLGLLVGVWVGRARGLILAGLLLGLALVPSAFLDAATDGDWAEVQHWPQSETHRIVPASVADIEPSYHIDSGRLVLDLRRLDLDGADTETSLSVLAGEIVVLLPPDADFAASATVDIGELELDGTREDGLDLDSSVTTSENGVNDLVLTLDVNVGSAEVRREAA